MHIRCKSCHGTIWVEPPLGPEPAPSIRCKTCAQEYSVEGMERLRSGERRLALDARKLAETHGVDLPGAYSVLFGIMTPEEVLELGDGSSAACRTTAKAPETSHPETRVAYDRAFQPAIDAGLLSVFEAAERGQREAYAQAVAQRHKLSLSVALDIADNRISLLNCLRDRPNDQSEEIVASVPRNARRYFGWAAAGFAVVVTAALVIASASPDAPGTVTRTVRVSGAEVRIDDRGRLLRVAAPDPRTVLEAFCASRTGLLTAEAIAVVPAKRGGREARLGLFHEGPDASRIFMIEILENRAAGHWVVGDGMTPIVPKNAPAGALNRDPATGRPG